MSKINIKLDYLNLQMNQKVLTKVVANYIETNNIDTNVDAITAENLLEMLYDYRKETDTGPLFYIEELRTHAGEGDETSLYCTYFDENTNCVICFYDVEYEYPWLKSVDAIAAQLIWFYNKREVTYKKFLVLKDK